MKIFLTLALIISLNTGHCNDIEVSIQDVVSGEADTFYIEDFTKLPDLLNQIKGHNIEFDFHDATSGLSLQIDNLSIRAMRIGGSEGGND